MKVFYDFFVLELKRLLSRKNIILFLLFLLVALYFVQDGITDYKNVMKNKENFQEIERLNIKKFINYTQYGAYGFRLLFVPSPISIFFCNSGLSPELTAFLDSGVRLRIYNSSLGKNLYSEKPGGFKDFFGIILLIGSLLCLLWGYDCLHHREYLKFLSSILNYKKVYFSTIWSRIILFAAIFLFTVGCSLLLLELNDVSLSSNEYFFLSIYVVVMLFLFLFFFMLGVLCGSLKSKSLGIIIIVVLWLSLVLFLPGTISKIVSKKADNIASVYDLEQKKLKLLQEFEKKSFDEAQRYTNMKERQESERKLIESYWNNEFKKIQSYEKKMQEEMERNLKYFHVLSLVIPPSFYLSVHDEISSKGYRNFFDFYQYSQQLQRRFVRYYQVKKFYSNYTKVESFIKGDEDIFFAKSRLPWYFVIGMLIMLLYVVVLYFVSYSRFKKFLFVLPEKTDPDPNKLDLSINSGESVVLLTTARTIIDQLYNVFSGIGRGFKGRVLHNKKNIVPVQNKQKENFIYICQPDKIPCNIDATGFISFFKKILHIRSEEMDRFTATLNIEQINKKNIGDLKDKEKGRFLFALAQLKGSSVYMIHDLAKGMPIDFITDLKEQLKRLKEEGAAILYLSNDVLLATKIGDRVTYLLNDPSLPQCLDNYITL